MLKVALRGLLARKFRLALTAAAVLHGVMFVTTTYVLTDTLDESFNRIFEQSLSDAGQGSVKSVQIAGRDHRSIIARFGERDDETSGRLLEFVRGLVGEPTAAGAQ